MEKITTKLGIILFGLFGLINLSHAALNDLGNGLVNDDVLDITWMQDANLVKTSCDANNALWQALIQLRWLLIVDEAKHKFVLIMEH